MHRGTTPASMRLHRRSSCWAKGCFARAVIADDVLRTIPHRIVRIRAILQGGEQLRDGFIDASMLDVDDENDTSLP